jgi:uracil phosphoribosyltransferase
MTNNYKNFKLIDHPFVKRDISILRDKKTDPELFRSVVSRISNIIAVEISRNFEIKKTTVQTPLERTIGYSIKQDSVLIPVLRAGLGMINGFLGIMPNAKVGHIGLERDETTLKPNEYYYKAPKNLNRSNVILLDPMLATGGSASQAIKLLKKRGAKKIFFACLVAAPEGINKIYKDHPHIQIFGAALDRELNNKGFILPGLGDAGDRTFGTL